MSSGNGLLKVWKFYVDGFRNMTWGRPLWIVIGLKLFILFAVLRVFFFRPVLAGKSDEQKSEIVGTTLTEWVTSTEETTLTEGVLSTEETTPTEEVTSTETTTPIEGVTSTEETNLTDF